MNDGKRFEQSFQKSVPNDVYYFRIKDSASGFGQDSTAVRFTPNNPYDQFLFYQYLFPMELKSTKGTSMSIQFSKEEKGKMIKLHQIQGLTHASQFDGIYAGFLFDFRTSNNTYYLDISDFNRFLSNVNKKSINEKDIVDYGGIIIDKTLKRVNYSYDIHRLIKNIINKCEEKLLCS